MLAGTKSCGCRCPTRQQGCNMVEPPTAKEVPIPIGRGAVVKKSERHWVLGSTLWPGFRDLEPAKGCFRRTGNVSDR